MAMPNHRAPQHIDPSQPAAASSDSMAKLRALGYSAVPKAKPVLRGHAVPAAQAALGSGVLGPLLRQAQASQACLQALRSVLPPALWAQLQSGPIADGLWTLLVSAPAAAAKIRQWVPALQAHVRSKGWPIERIDVKVHRP
jgi:hypothetical protein